MAVGRRRGRGVRRRPRDRVRLVPEAHGVARSRRLCVDASRRAAAGQASPPPLCDRAAARAGTRAEGAYLPPPHSAGARRCLRAAFATRIVAGACVGRTGT
jgi:hypothetical protein